MMKNTSEVPVLMALIFRGHLWEGNGKRVGVEEMKENISLVYIVKIFHNRN